MNAGRRREPDRSVTVVLKVTLPFDSYRTSAWGAISALLGEIKRRGVEVEVVLERESQGVPAPIDGALI